MGWMKIMGYKCIYLLHIWKKYGNVNFMCTYILYILCNIVIISVQYHPPTWTDSHSAWWSKLQPSFQVSLSPFQVGVIKVNLTANLNSGPIMVYFQIEFQALQYHFPEERSLPTFSSFNAIFVSPLTSRSFQSLYSFGIRFVKQLL